MTKIIEKPETIPELPPEILDDVTRREFLIGSAGLLLLPAGCAGSGEEGDASGPGETRTVRHPLGETKVPARPRRIAAMDGTSLLAALLLDAPVVARTTANSVGADAFHAEIEAIRTIGGETQPSLERLAALEPDLILSAAYEGEMENYERLSRIAPTVPVNYGPFNWRQFHLDVGEAVGKPEEAERQVADTNRRIEEVRDRIPPGTSVAMIRANPTGVSAYPGFYPADLIDELGLETPELLTFREGECCLTLSQEMIPELEGADYIFFAVDTPGAVGESGRGTADDFRQSPLWRRLEAVQEGRVIEVASDAWISPSLSGANRVIGDIERAILGGDSSSKG